ncbi:MAG: helix-turn-helix domain-containing protein [Candidatus Acidiferrales bacterium]
MEVSDKLGSYHLPDGVNQLLTINEVAAILSVNASWVYKHLNSKDSDRLPGIRVGKYWRFRAADLRAWIEARRRA